MSTKTAKWMPTTFMIEIRFEIVTFFGEAHLFRTWCGAQKWFVVPIFALNWGLRALFRYFFRGGYVAVHA
jgi:hypothetical protein